MKQIFNSKKWYNTVKNIMDQTEDIEAQKDFEDYKKACDDFKWVYICEGKEVVDGFCKTKFGNFRILDEWTDWINEYPTTKKPSIE